MRFLRVTVGTAGHIDHGKSTLIKAVTGTDPDRLKEEQERGMTIDIGFAEYKMPDGTLVGIIDVPGHERFIKNMVAGAVGIDFVLLVIAADDGVMPQTREHLEIMELLGISRGMVVLTKIDLVEEEMLELAEDDVRGFLKGTFLESAPLVKVSAVTGEGIEEFRRVFEEEVGRIKPRTVEGVFRLPVQRVFVAPGFGCVVTGVVLSGLARQGDAVEVYPERLRGRIRSIQVYKEPVKEASAGHRTALALADVEHRRVHRGSVVASPNSLSPSNIIECDYIHLESAPFPLKTATPIRLHIGTQEVLGHAFPLQKSQMEPGERGLVQLRLSHPAVCAVGDRFILRLASPMLTLGGGAVIGLSGRKITARKGPIISVLRKRAAAEDHKQTVETLIAEAYTNGLSADAAARLTAKKPPEVKPLLEQLTQQGRVIFLEDEGIYIHKDALESVKERLLKALTAFHKKFPLKRWCDQKALFAHMRLNEELLEAAFDELLKEKKIESEGRNVAVAGWRVELSAESARIAAEISRIYKDAKLKAPNKSEVVDRVSGQLSRIEAIYEYLVDEGELVRLTESLYIHRDAFEEAVEKLRAYIRKEGRIDAQGAKALFGLSRKYIIPLLEAMDRRRITRRVGDHRILLEE